MNERTSYSIPIRCWLTVVCLVCFWNFFTVPYRFAFDVQFEGVWRQLDWIGDGILIMDILIKLTRRYREKGKDVDQKERFNFRVAPSDLIASLPLDLIIIATGYTIGGIGGGSALWRLPRLFRMHHCFSYLHPWRGALPISHGILRIIKFLIILACAAHIIGCAFFFTAIQEGVFRGTWVVHEGLLTATPITQYLHSVYWTMSTMTTVGYGDITPTTNIEIVFAMFVQMMGALMYSFIIGNVVSALTDLDASGVLLRRKLATIESYMKHSNLPTSLRSKIRGYYQFLWSRHKDVVSPDLLIDLPQSLRVDIFTFRYAEMVDNVPLFRGAEPKLVKAIALCLKSRIAAPGEAIIERGEKGDSMFFLIHGSASITTGEDQKAMHSVEEGSFFGEVALLYSQTRTATVTATTWCDMLMLTRKDFDHLLAEYPKFSLEVRRNAREMYRTSASNEQEAEVRVKDYKPDSWKPLDMPKKEMDPASPTED